MINERWISRDLEGTDPTSRLSIHTFARRDWRNHKHILRIADDKTETLKDIWRLPKHNLIPVPRISGKSDWKTAILWSRSQWLRGLRCRSAAARLLGLWVRISPEAWLSVSCECYLGVGLIIHPEEFYWVWCVWVWSWRRDNEEALNIRSCYAVDIYITREEVQSKINVNNGSSY
jgi:hypothetical protein